MQELQKIGERQTGTSAVLIRDGSVLLGLRNYIRANEWKTIPMWTTPGGRCDPGEIIEHGLRRETKEETGITRLQIIKFIGTFPSAAQKDDIVHFFLCETDEEPKLLEPDKFSAWEWFPADNLPVNFINPYARKFIHLAVRSEQ